MTTFEMRTPRVGAVAPSAWPFLERPTRALVERMGEVCQGSPVSGPAGHALNPPGKLVRPRMLLAAVDAVGGDPLSAVPAAYGVECCHVASLVHDDVIDDDAERRGRPSVHRAYGADVAIVTGDALLFESFTWGDECIESGMSPQLVGLALGAFAAAGRHLCAGQALEGDMSRRGRWSRETYLAMVNGKTGAMIELPCLVGAVLGGAAWPQVERLAAFGAAFGTAFQMQDDLLPFRNFGENAGKDRYSDVRNGRPSLPFVLAVEVADPVGRDYLLASQREAAQGRPVDEERMLNLVGSAPVIATAESLIDEYVTTARELIEPFETTDGGAFLRALLEESVCRTR